MEPDKQVQKKRSRGFTINEVLITTGIIAALTVIAVPNFLRMKMNVNMELVKQNLKIIGQNMNDLFNKYKEFPADISNLGTSEEELAITASLFAIDKKDYSTASGYKTFVNRTNYQLIACPKDGKWGIAGDRCFILTPMGITETAIQPAIEVPMISLQGLRTEGILAALFEGNESGQDFGGAFSNLSQNEQIDILTGLIEMGAYYSSSQMENMTSCAGCVSDWKDRKPSTYLTIFESGLNSFKKLLPEVSKKLESQGFQLYYEERGKETNYQTGGSILGVSSIEMPGPGSARTDGIDGNYKQADNEKLGNIYIYEISLISNEPISAAQAYDGMNTALNFADEVYSYYGYSGDGLADPNGNPMDWKAG